jgi:hypothetical protein
VPTPLAATPYSCAACASRAKTPHPAVAPCLAASHPFPRRRRFFLRSTSRLPFSALPPRRLRQVKERSQVCSPSPSHLNPPTATGKSKNAAKSALEKLDLSTLTAKDAVKEVAKILYAQHDPSKDKPLELELS